MERKCRIRFLNNLARLWVFQSPFKPIKPRVIKYWVNGQIKGSSGCKISLIMRYWRAKMYTVSLPSIQQSNSSKNNIRRSWSFAPPFDLSFTYLYGRVLDFNQTGKPKFWSRTHALRFQVVLREFPISQSFGDTAGFAGSGGWVGVGAAGLAATAGTAGSSSNSSSP